MKNIIDFILESKGQRISQRAGNRPYDVKDDKLLKKKESRPQRAQELRVTKLDKQVQEFCSALVNDFMVKFYNLTNSNDKLLSFDERITRVFRKLEKDQDLNNVKPETLKYESGCVFLHTNVYDNDSSKSQTDYILQYKKSDSFTNILKKLDFYFKVYSVTGWGRIDTSDEGNTKLSIKFTDKFFTSVLNRLRKHDLAKRMTHSFSCDLFDLFDDIADNYNKNYFADKFEEFEKAYNDVLANW